MRALFFLARLSSVCGTAPRRGAHRRALLPRASPRAVSRWGLRVSPVTSSGRNPDHSFFLASLAVASALTMLIGVALTLASACWLPSSGHSPARVAPSPLRTLPLLPRRCGPALLTESDEIERAQRRRDEAARRAEMDADAGGFDDASLDMLKERIDLLETREVQMQEIKDMLRTMEPSVGVRFVSDDDEILASAWVFIALNVLVALWALKLLLVDPALRTVGWQ